MGSLWEQCGYSNCGAPGQVRALSPESPALVWVPADEEMSPWSPCTSERQKHLLGSWVTSFPRESPWGLLLMLVFSVNTVVKLFKYSDNMVNKQKDNTRLEQRKVQELFVCPWVLLATMEDTKAPSPCFSGASS